VAHRESGLPLGLFADSRYPDSSVDFGENDLLVLYTDGIVEAQDAAGEPFGRDRLMATVRRHKGRGAAALVKALWRRLEAFTGTRALRDDATLVVIRGVTGFGSRDANGTGSSRRGRAEAMAPVPVRDGGRAGTTRATVTSAAGGRR
jgi:hypothetical protein